MAVTKEMTLVRFEDVEAYREARALARAVYGVTDGAAMRRDPILIAAVRQAATSVMAAVAEAFRESDLRYAIRRLRQAEDAVRDVRGLFYVAIESGLFASDQYEDLVTVAARAGRAITALAHSARSRAHGEIDLVP